MREAFTHQLTTVFSSVLQIGKRAKIIYNHRPEMIYEFELCPIYQEYQNPVGGVCFVHDLETNDGCTFYLIIDKFNQIINTKNSQQAIGYNYDDLYEHKIDRLIEKNEFASNACGFFQDISFEHAVSGIADKNHRVLIKGKAGDVTAFQYTSQPVGLEKSEAVLLKFVNIDETYRWFTNLHDWWRLIFVLTESVPDLYVVLDSKQMVVYANAAARKHFLSEQYEKCHIDSLFSLYDTVTHRRVYFSDTTYGFANRKFTPDYQKREHIYQVRIMPLVNKQCAFLQFVNVTTAENHLAEVQWLSEHDHLTGLNNRSCMLRAIKQLLDESAVNPRVHYLLYIDLDGFKSVNDGAGHAAGDLLLQKVSDALSKMIRSGDTLARVGGDEFCLLVTGCSSQRVSVIAQNIINTIVDLQFIYDNQLFHIGASIGIREFFDNEESSDECLLSDADAACYQAKQSGKCRFVFFSPESHEHIDEQIDLNRILEALDNDNFELFFQRIEGIQSDVDCYWEVLLRLDGGELTIKPSVFFPIANRYQKGHLIDRWVANHLARYLNQLVSRNVVLPLIAINLSAETVMDKKAFKCFVNEFISAGISLEKVCIEVSEKLILTNMTTVKENLSYFKKMGGKIAFDHFGQGMSSFTYLREVDVDIVKVDGDLIRKIDKDELSVTLLQSIYQISRVLDCDVVAEQVDSPFVLGIIKEIGIRYAQGFEIEKPISVSAWLQAVSI